MTEAPGVALSDSSSPVVRAMSPPDVPTIVSILAESPEASMWSQLSISESVARGTAWVALHEGNVIGFLIGRAAGDEFEILNMAVARAHRRHGVATHLLDEALKWSRTAGTQRAYLEVRASNEAAIALYRRHGFSIFGRRPRYYAYPTEDAIVLSRDTR